MNVYVDSYESDKRKHDEGETGKERDKYKIYTSDFFSH
jgi:hypothetical protein